MSIDFNKIIKKMVGPEGKAKKIKTATTIDGAKNTIDHHKKVRPDAIPPAKSLIATLKKELKENMLMERDEKMLKRWRLVRNNGSVINSYDSRNEALRAGRIMGPGTCRLVDTEKDLHK